MHARCIVYVTAIVAPLAPFPGTRWLRRTLLNLSLCMRNFNVVRDERRAVLQFDNANGQMYSSILKTPRYMKRLTFVDEMYSVP